MRFVFGRASEHGPTDWFLQLKSHRLNTPESSKVLDLWLSHQLRDIRSAHSSFLSDFCFLFNLRNKDVERLLSRDKWYVNRVGGMCPNLHEVLDELESNEFPPSLLTKEQLIEGVKISSWPNGKHFYARLPDGTDVIVDDKSGFDSRAEALEATKRFVQERFK
jgi:hypothetical protein